MTLNTPPSTPSDIGAQIAAGCLISLLAHALHLLYEAQATESHLLGHFHDVRAVRLYAPVRRRCTRRATIYAALCQEAALFGGVLRVAHRARALLDAEQSD